VVAPFAIKVTELPLHNVAEEGVTVIVGFGFTVMVEVAVFVQTPLVPVTVIVLVEVGLAITVAPVEGETIVVGDQV
jgi:hypothetical protein